MSKTIPGSFLLIFIFSFTGYSQCLTPLPAPACNGTEPLALDGETISSGTTKWYYGSTLTMSSLTLDGGTLVICGNLTVDKFYMNTGKVFIRSGGHFIIGSGIGAGLQFKGDCAIYNYGTCEIQRNLSLEDDAAVATPNIVYNALSTSVFLMSNQYFVIGNAYSKFVNNGRAEFWGIITDNQASAASTCLGNGSTTKMAILINKVVNSYIVPNGNACVHVFQQSEFYGQLTSSPTLLACLGSNQNSSTSCIPFGCHPNWWGAAQVITDCSGCAAVMIALPVQFDSFDAINNNDGTNKLGWETDSGIGEGVITVLRSSDGKQYASIDSMTIDKSSTLVFSLIDKHPLEGNNYYMIRYKNMQTGMTISSRIAKVISKIKSGFTIYPIPFDDKFFINYEQGTKPQKVGMTDPEGRTINTRNLINKESRSVEVTMLNKLQPGLYIIYMQTDKNLVVKPIFKK